MDPLIESAIRSLQAGQTDAAEQACRRRLAANPSDAEALQVLASVHHRFGRLAEAEAAFARSLEIAPRNPQFRTNFALLLTEMGRTDQSLAELERALVIEPRFRPARLALARLSNVAQRHEAAAVHARKLIAENENDSEAWSALGAALFAQNRISQARAAFERACSLNPTYGAARYNLAAALCEEERAEEAFEQSDHATRLGAADRGLMFIRARALMQLDRYGEAESVLQPLVDSAPADTEAQFLLAQLRHVRGDTDFARSFREAVQRSDAPVYLAVSYADLMRRAGEYALAEQSLRTLANQHGPLPQLANSLSLLLQERGQPGEAARILSDVALAHPQDATIAENLVTALLSSGEPEQALPLVERFRIATPNDQRWITYRADIARQRDEKLFAEWCAFDHLVRTYDIEPPTGYSSIAAFHAELRPVLESHHRQASHPLNQSLRHGTQSSRGLLASRDPMIQAFLASLARPIAEYQQAIGRDRAHPLLARNLQPARLVGCWSVRLSSGGFHVNHIHPQGWLSSAYYVSVPREAEDPAARCGWLKLGEPRFPTPRGEVARFVQPREGRLVLFPSYMWHGTQPTVGAEARLTVAFDAVP